MCPGLQFIPESQNLQIYASRDEIYLCGCVRKKVAVNEESESL